MTRITLENNSISATKPSQVSSFTTCKKQNSRLNKLLINSPLLDKVKYYSFNPSYILFIVHVKYNLILWLASNYFFLYITSEFGGLKFHDRFSCFTIYQDKLVTKSFSSSITFDRNTNDIFRYQICEPAFPKNLL